MGDKILRQNTNFGNQKINAVFRMQLEIKVSGRVQGVGFRYFVKQKADDFNLKGWVRNTSDWGVAIVAEGNEPDLNTFADWIKLGPPLSRIDKVEINRFDRTTGFRSFEIRF